MNKLRKYLLNQNTNPTKKSSTVDGKLNRDNVAPEKVVTIVNEVREEMKKEAENKKEILLGTWSYEV